MATLDISLVIFALVVVLILDLLAISIKQRFFAGLGLVFSVTSIAYFISNYNVVGVGTNTFPFELFMVAWVCLPIFVSFFLVIVKRY